MDLPRLAPARRYRVRASASGGRPIRLIAELLALPAVRDTVVVTVLLVAGVLLSAPALGPTSLWLDDAWLALVHRVSEPSHVLDAGLTAPGFALLLKAWLATVGFSETAAQALPFVAGVTVPPAVYVTGRRIGLAAPAAGLAALVALVSPVRIEYAARVKPFAVDALTATALVWLAWRAAEEPGRWTRWALLTGVALVAVVVSTSVLPVAAAAVAGAALAAWRTPHRSAAVAWAAGLAIGAAAWVLVVVSPRIRPELRDYWAGRYLEGPADVWRIVRSFASDLIGLEHGAAVGLVAVALVIGFAVAARRRAWSAVVLGGPLLLAAGLAVVGKAPLGTGRTDLYLYPALALAVGWTVQHAPWRPWVAGLAIVGVAATGMTPSEAGYPQEEFAPLTAVLEQRIEEDDLALLTASTVYGVALYGPWTAGLEPAETTTGFTPVFDDARILRAPGQGRLEGLLGSVAPGGRVWLFSSRTSDEAGESLRRRLAVAGWEVETRWAADGATLERWRRSSAA